MDSPEWSRTLQQIQEDKRRLFAIGEGEFTLRLPAAALALSISEELLDKVLIQQGKGLEVRATADGVVIFSLQDMYPERDLWDEVLRTLRVGRSQLGDARDLYEMLFVVCKSLVAGRGDRLASLAMKDDIPLEITSVINFLRQKGNVRCLDVEMADLQQMAMIAFLGLPKGAREELKHQARSPEFLMVQGEE